MELSFSLGHLTKNAKGETRRGIAESAAFTKAAGFEYVDYSPNCSSDGWEKAANRDREILDDAGIKVEQTHAPFNRYCQFDEEKFPVYYKRLFEASKILGAKYVVVHADEYRVGGRYDEKEILDFTCRYLEPYVDYAAKNGMIVAVENLFEDDSWRWPQVDGKSRFTSRVEELISVIERFNTPNVKCCWDFGHAKCAFGKDGMAEALKQAAKYVVCTHVHDNYYDKDLHLVPFLGDTDWRKNLSVLKDAGYGGKLSFEFVYGEMPDALLPEWMAYVYSTGKYMSEIFEGKI